MADLVERLEQTTLEMANRCSVPMELWDRHSNAALEAAATITALRDRVAEVERERDEWRFRPPLGDNHHNALKCPYCNPEQIDPAKERARATAAEAAIARLRDEVVEARTARDLARYMLHHADFALVGLRFPDDGTKSCIGSDPKKFNAAKNLRNLGLVEIEDSPAGPFVSWARALNRDTHHETR